MQGIYSLPQNVCMHTHTTPATHTVRYTITAYDTLKYVAFKSVPK